MNKKNLVFAIILLYVLPSFIQVEYTDNQKVSGVYLGFPIVQTGDEPHYYVTLFSLVNDRDVFLTNNYNNAFYRGCPDLGTKKWVEINRHTRLFDAEKKTVTNIPFINTRDINLSYVPLEGSSVKEIPGHAIGLPLFAFLFLWPLKNTRLLEYFAIYLTLIISLLGILAFYKIMLFYHKNENKALIFTVVFAFATQYWHYSKTFWAEPYLASFLVISWYLVVVKRTYFAAGLLLGFGFLMKYPFILAILPFYILTVSNKNSMLRTKSVISFTIPLFLFFAIVLSLNYYLTNNVMQFNQAEAVSFVSPLKGGLYNWFFNPTFGLFTFSPVLAFAFFGVRNFWKKSYVQCIAVALIIISYVLFWASYVVSQVGGGGYSARYFVPLIPFFVLICSFINIKNKFVKCGFWVLLSISVLINSLAAFAYPAFIGYPIMVSVYKIVSFAGTLL